MSRATVDRYSGALEERAALHNLRSLRPSRPLPGGRLELGSKILVNFASNDYLGLSQHPTLIRRATEFTERYGVGNGASRLLSGNLHIFEQIESKLARLKGSETALILPSGFQTNSTVIPSILNSASIALADRLVHRSLIEGLLLSKSKWSRFRHFDYDDMLERLKRSPSSSSRWVFTESVFSMDGDCLDFSKLLKIAGQEKISLFIDEAHATGVLGKNGMGLSAGLSFEGISMGTFGKGLGSFGAYVCCSRTVREYLINFCPGFVYSTALPPPVLGAIDAALDIVPEMDREREQLADSAYHLRCRLQEMGFETGNSSSQIVPVIMGASTAALNLSEYLESCGFYVPAIRPPTVAEGSARLRISLSALHSQSQVDEFLNAVRKWNEKKN